MTSPRSTGATDAARSLWARAGGAGVGGVAVGEAAERMYGTLRAGLGPWVGLPGFDALVDRAVEIARTDHPVLRPLAVDGGQRPLALTVLQQRPPGEVAEGMVALVADLIELLGRIIGEQMAIRLIEQTGIPDPRGSGNQKTENQDG